MGRKTERKTIRMRERLKGEGERVSEDLSQRNIIPAAGTGTSSVIRRGSRESSRQHLQYAQSVADSQI